MQGAVHGHAEVQLAGDVVSHGHQHLGDELSLGARLVGHERLAQQAGRGVLRLLGRAHELHALGHVRGPRLASAGDRERLVAVVLWTDRHALAAAPGVDLGLQHHRLAAELVERRQGLGRAAGDEAPGHGRALGGQQLFRLVFVDLHVGVSGAGE